MRNLLIIFLSLVSLNAMAYTKMVCSFQLEPHAPSSYDTLYLGEDMYFTDDEISVLTVNNQIAEESYSDIYAKVESKGLKSEISLFKGADLLINANQPKQQTEFSLRAEVKGLKYGILIFSCGAALASHE